MSVLQDSYTTGNDTSWWTATDTYRAQTFTAGSSYTIISVELLLYRTGLPGTITVSLRTTNVTTGKPETEIASGTADGDTLTTDSAGEWKGITFSSPVALTSGLKYAIVISISNGAYPVRVVRWNADTSTGYAGGGYTSSVDSGVTWATVSGSTDLLFKTYSADVVYAEFSGSSDSVSDIDGTLVEAVIHAFSGSFESNSSLSGTWGFLASVLLSGSIVGVSTVSATILIHPAEGWPPTRFEDYDPDKFWDEETETWTDIPTIGPGSRIEHLIVVGEQGEIYFGEI